MDVKGKSIPTTTTATTTITTRAVVNVGMPEVAAVGTGDAVVIQKFSYYKHLN